MIQKKLEQLKDSELIKQGIDMGADTVKSGIGSIINAILIKIVLAVLAITVITIGGCTAYNSLTGSSDQSETLSEVQQNK